MKGRHRNSYRVSAIETLKWLGISQHQKFDSLKPIQVIDILAEADRAGYRIPKQAIGSRETRARRYFEQLVRHAKLKPVVDPT